MSFFYIFAKNVMEDLINDYKNGMDIYSICDKYHFGKLKVKKILTENGVEIRKRGGQCKNKSYVLTDWSIEKYKKENGYHYIAISKFGDGFTTRDYMNSAGVLTSYIRNKFNVDIPTLYDRREYYKLTGNYWWEQWFDIKKEADVPTKKCPYCNWKTVDVNNNTGAFEVHLLKKHGINKIQFLQTNENEKKYFSLKSLTLNRQMECDENKFVICQICGKKLARIDDRHLIKHNITKEEYIKQYGFKVVSNELHDKLSKTAVLANSKIEKTYESSYEKEIKEFIKSNGFECYKDRKVLNGEELDIYIPKLNIAIEFNGIYWHQEKFGKDKYYHLQKLNKCNEKGIKLLQIFEDEYVNKKELVLSKISHLLHLTQNKIYARKCIVNEISIQDAEAFLNQNHIQGFSKSSVYLGATYNDCLVAVMTFTRENDDKWELKRFATLNGYNVIGIGGKLFSYFIKNDNPNEVKSFADRRWTLDANDNLYVKLGFELNNVLPPDYKYYNQKIDKFKRFHKFNFRKEILHRKYGFPMEMTETEMTRELGFDRIWDCGLFKYVWTNKNIK